jgi:hypothetical protein
VLAAVVACLPLPVRHGEPAGAAQVDIQQSRDSTRLKSSLTTPNCFMWVFQSVSRLQQLMKLVCHRWVAARRVFAAGVSRATTYETPPPGRMWKRPIVRAVECPRGCEGGRVAAKGAHRSLGRPGRPARPAPPAGTRRVAARTPRNGPAHRPTTQQADDTASLTQ